MTALLIRSLIGLFLLLTSCTATQYPIRYHVSERTFDTSRPGTAQEKNVGDVMVEVGHARIENAFTFVASKSIPSLPFTGLFYTEIPEGTTWTCNSMTEKHDYICSNLGWGIGRTPFGTLASYRSSPIISDSGDLVGIQVVEHGYATYYDKPFKDAFSKRVEERPLAGSFKQELIYQGRSREGIKISYREYKNDFARPAFYQDLTYDISESKDIAFRNIRMEILSATNVSIKFVVK